MNVSTSWRANGTDDRRAPHDVVSCTKRRHNVKERGFVMFTVVFASVAIIGFAGLVMDVGMMQFYKRKAQAAADAAALGGAFEIYKHGSADAQLAVTHDAGLNGFTNGANGVSIVSNNPPASGPNTGKSKYMEVLISKQVPSTFMRILNFRSASVVARAVGGPSRVNACIYVLDSSASNAFSTSGSAILNSQCGIMVNSTSATGASIAGSSCITASSISVTGGYSVTSTCPPNVTPRSGVAAVADPFANLAAPSVGGCTATSLILNTNTTINPGVYCNGIVMGGGGHTLTLNPGTYILSGGGLTMKAGTIITGTGVTIYNTAANGYGYKPLTFAGNTHIILSAPTSGPMESILFYTDRSIVNTTNNTITGDSTSTIVGSIYMPNVPLQFIGNSTLIAYTVLAVGRLSLTGNATINDDYSSLQSGAPISAGAIVAE